MEYATPASVGKSMRNATSEKQRQEIISTFINKDYTNGGIMTHLAADKDHRPSLIAYVKEKPDTSFTEMFEHSDPNLTAVSWLASESEELRPSLVAKVVDTLANSEAGLTVLARIAALNRWNGVKVDEHLISATFKYAASTKKPILAKVLIIISSLMSQAGTEEDIMAWIDEHITTENGEGYAVASLLVTVDAGEVARRLLSRKSIKSHATEKNLWFLELLSGACTDKQTRTQVASDYGEFVDKALKAPDHSGTKLLGSAIRTKLLAGAATDLKGDAIAEELDKLSPEFEHFIKNNGLDAILLNSALEGLATTSLLSSVKLRCGTVIPHLAEIVKLSEDASAVYCALTILSNITLYPQKDTKEQEKLKALQEKVQGGPSAFDIQPKPTIDEVGNLVDIVIESRVVDVLNRSASRLSIASRAQLSAFLRNISCQQAGNRRLKLAHQGLVVTAIYLWICDKPNQEISKADKSIAASAAAKILASVEPQQALTTKFPVNVIIDVLQSQICNATSLRPNLDTMEGLMALTNLTSVEDPETRKAVANKCFGSVQQALQIELTPIQRAALQLICNLCACEAGASYFLHPSSGSKALVSLLAHALSSEDRDIRLAVSGALAMLADWDRAPEVLSHNTDFMREITNALPNHDDPIDSDFLVRVLSTISTVLRGCQKMGDDTVADDMIYRGGIVKIDQLVERIETGGVKEAVNKNLLIQAFTLLTLFRTVKESS